jgi:hypothetical protein
VNDKMRDDSLLAQERFLVSLVFKIVRSSSIGWATRRQLRVSTGLTLCADIVRLERSTPSATYDSTVQVRA